jgi:hypothetical protein
MLDDRPQWINSMAPLVEMALKRVETPTPQPTVRVQPGIDLPQRLGAQAL